MAAGAGRASAPSAGRGAVKRWHPDGSRPHRAWNQPLYGTDYVVAAQPYTDAEPEQAGKRGEPGAILVIQAAAGPSAERVAIPAPPARPEIREYSWAAASGEPAATFVIILKDGTVHMAVAVCRQDSRLTYVAPGGSAGAVEAVEVDRNATRQANSTDLLQ